jgi:hypothetical protein
MPDPDFSAPDKTSTPKKPISPARHIVGVVALVAVLGFGGLEYSQKLGYNSAVNALAKRTQSEDDNMMTVQEAETLLNKAPDGPGVDVRDGAFDLTKKTYTWSGMLKSYTLTAYYTKSKDSRMVRFETPGAALPKEPVSEVTNTGHSRAIATKPAPKGSDPRDKSAAAPAKDGKPTPKPAEGDAKPAVDAKPATAPAPTPAKDGN